MASKPAAFSDPVPPVLREMLGLSTTTRGRRGGESRGRRGGGRESGQR